jgi:hypothetical protein
VEIGARQAHKCRDLTTLNSMTGCEDILITSRELLCVENKSSSNVAQHRTLLENRSEPPNVICLCYITAVRPMKKKAASTASL